MSQPSNKPPCKKGTLAKELSFISATALVLNIIIGAGVLVTASGILQHTKSFGLSIVLWVVGGLLVYAASLCYLELALLLKISGGTYINIKEAYSFGKKKPWMEMFGSLCGFVYVWCDILIQEPLGLAISLLSMGSYICRPFFINCQEMPIYAVKMFALCGLSMHVIAAFFNNTVKPPCCDRP